MSNCSSLENLLAAIDKTIAEYDYKTNPRYLDSLCKQAEGFRKAADYMNRETDRILRSKKYDIQ